MAAEFVSHLHDSKASMPAGERHAALALHGMAAADREWMLQQLGDERRAVLEGLLAELRELGVAAEPPLPVEGAGAEASANASTEASPRQALAQLPGAALHRLLRDEPDGLIADVLTGLGPLHGQAELLRLLRGSGRILDPLLQAPGPLASRRADALAEALLRRVAATVPAMQAAVGPAPLNAPPRWFERLLPRRPRSR